MLLFIMFIVSYILHVISGKYDRFFIVPFSIRIIVTFNIYLYCYHRIAYRPSHLLFLKLLVHSESPQKESQPLYIVLKFFFHACIDYTLTLTPTLSISLKHFDSINWCKLDRYGQLVSSILFPMPDPLSLSLTNKLFLGIKYLIQYPISFEFFRFFLGVGCFPHLPQVNDTRAMGRRRSTVSLAEA